MGYALLFRYLVLGDAGVGKTSLLRLFTEGQLPPQGASHVGASGAVSGGRLTLLYGELDVFAHAWAPSLHEIVRELLPPSRLAAGRGASSNGVSVISEPLILRHDEALARRAASVAPRNDLYAALYSAPLPIGPARGTGHAVGGARTCRSLGFRLLWNTAVHPIPGLPAPGRTSRGCKPLEQAEAESAHGCCALCAANAGTCSSWSYYAPTCYWSLRCERRTIEHRETMWGAVAGVPLDDEPAAGSPASAHAALPAGKARARGRGNRRARRGPWIVGK